MLHPPVPVFTVLDIAQKKQKQKMQTSKQKNPLGIKEEKWQHRETKSPIEHKENETNILKMLFCSNEKTNN